MKKQGFIRQKLSIVGHNLGIMRKYAILLISLVLFACDGNGGFSVPPGKKEAAEVIKAYLKKNSMCEGVLEIKELAVMSVTSEVTTGRGWKAKAVYIATCRTKNTSLEYIIANYTEENPYEILIKADGEGWYEAYMPNEMQKAVDKQVKNMVNKIHSR